ncbi:uncharacterized protein LOC141632581 [Silene latifolia]|uniref:uncharacterized protein LOC141632581 n=1 Tax=Silene latifolia TaxID=37657 RepID=UPI003D775B2C
MTSITMGGFGFYGTLSLTVLGKSAQHIHCALLHHATQRRIEVTFVYAFNVRQDRKELWRQLQIISAKVAAPWICLGDFNVVLKMEERLGSDHIHLVDMQEFGQCLDSCGLADHPATGCQFTWNNKQGNGLRLAKLDRILASQQWFCSYPSTASFLNVGISDHSSCLVKLADNSHIRRNFRLKGFLKEIHVASFTNLPARATEAQQALLSCQAQLQTSPMDPLLHAKEKALLTEYLLIKKVELQALSQRAKVHELKSDDLGTRFFYARIATRKTRNNIGTILDDSGRLCTGTQEVAQGFVSYYESLLGTSSPVMPLPEDLFESNLVPTESCAYLVKLVLLREILDALKSIDRNKSPSIDGYSSGFFLDAWSEVGPDFKAVVLEFFQTGVMPRAVNSTMLVLIPKLDTPSTVRDFRPIACCTTFYKVVSKILANKLKATLDSVIGPEQAAFVVDRDIFDNTMVAHELVSKYGGAYLTPRCLLKVDIRKAFDSVNWEFLRNYDLLVFTRGDLPSVAAVASYLETFNRLSGLQANPSNTWFSSGDFPFRYLGLPLFNARITKDMYQPLLDKIKDKIMHWANKNLSYAGGMGIKEVLSWNSAQMTKWVWKLLFKPGWLWSRWVTQYILKGRDIWHAQSSISHSWYWNNVIKMKELLLEISGGPEQALALLVMCTSRLRFDVSLIYELIRPRSSVVSWAPLVYDKGCHPKHSFIGMLALHDKLPSIDQLISRGIMLINRCSLCLRQCENITHFFFNCEFSTQVWGIVVVRLHLQGGTFELQATVNALLNARRNSLHNAGFLAAIY